MEIKEKKRREKEGRSSKVAKYSSFRIEGTFHLHNLASPIHPHPHIHRRTFHLFAESNQRPSNLTPWDKS